MFFRMCKQPPVRRWNGREDYSQYQQKQNTQNKPIKRCERLRDKNLKMLLKDTKVDLKKRGRHSIFLTQNSAL